MKVFKNLFGNGSKINASEVVTKDAQGNVVAMGEHVAATTTDNVHGISELLGTFRVVDRGNTSGVVLNMGISASNAYLFVVGRDHGLYFISQSNGVAKVTTLAAPAGSVTVTTTGTNVKIDFDTRSRPYVLFQLY